MTTAGPLTSARCSPSSSVTAGWPLHRILFLLAGTVTLTGIILGVFVNRWFLLLPAMAGANQLLMVAVGWCPMSLLLTRLGFGQPSVTTQPNGAR